MSEAGRGGWYRRFFAWLMVRMAPDHDELIADRKRELFAGLHGTVLEIGPGTGINLQYLPAGVRWIGVEPNVHMHPYLEATAREAGVEVDLRVGTAERLPADDGSVDAVISTLVLCSVTDVDGCLAEIRRVLRPEGRFAFVEHVAAEEGSRLLRWQRRIKPLWRRVGDGCTLDRDLATAIRAAGFRDVEIDAFSAELPIPLVRPHIAGRAVA